MIEFQTPPPVVISTLGTAPYGANRRGGINSSNVPSEIGLPVCQARASHVALFWVSRCLRALERMALPSCGVFGTQFHEAGFPPLPLTGPQLRSAVGPPSSTREVRATVE